MWRSLEQWMKARGLGTCARRLINLMKDVRSLDVVMKVKDRGPIRLRVVSRPDKLLADLLGQLDLPLPNRPKRIEIPPDVVAKTT